MKLAIVGAGISGLSLAHFLHKLNPTIDITIFEASDCVGGWVRTHRVGKDIFECGPKTFRIEEKSEPLLQIVKDLGLDTQLLLASSPAKKKFLARNGHLHQVPNSCSLLFRSWIGRLILKGCVRDLITKKVSSCDESVASFFRRRFGTTFTDTLIYPMMSGIYAADADIVSMHACFPEVALLEKQYRSIIIGKCLSKLRTSPWKHPLQGAIATFQDGMDTFPKALIASLSVDMRYNTRITGLQWSGGGVMLHWEDGSQYFDYIVSTIHPQWLDTVIKMPSIPMTSVVSVSLGYIQQQAIPEGFGFLTSRYEDSHLLGISFDSLVFPRKNSNFQTKLSVMMRIDNGKNYIEKAIQYVQKYLHIQNHPDITHVSIAENAIAAYPVDHKRSLLHIDTQLQNKPCSLIGTALYGVSLSAACSRAYQVAHTICR